MKPRFTSNGKRVGKKDLVAMDTVTIKLIQPAKLMKINDVLYLVFLNKKAKKLFQWDEGKWKKGSLWRTDTIEPSSPLEFLTLTGQTFASTVSKQFGLEVIE